MKLQGLSLQARKQCDTLHNIEQSKIKACGWHVGRSRSVDVHLLNSLFIRDRLSNTGNIAVVKGCMGQVYMCSSRKIENLKSE